MAIASEDAGGLPQEPTKGNIQDKDMASKCGGIDGCGLRGYTEAGLEAQLDLEGRFDCMYPYHIQSTIADLHLTCCLDNLLPPHISQPRLRTEFRSRRTSPRELRCIRPPSETNDLHPRSRSIRVSVSSIRGENKRRRRRHSHPRRANTVPLTTTTEGSQNRLSHYEKANYSEKR